MNITEFISNFKTHPILFVGTGVSLRYLKNSYSWENLLKRVALDLYGDDKHFYYLKSKSNEGGNIRYDILAEKLKDEFDDHLDEEKFEELKSKVDNEVAEKLDSINNVFLKEMRKGHTIDKFKHYLISLLNEIDINKDMEEEIASLKRASKNIGAVVTTNYDTFLESTLDFTPVIGNNVLGGNPYAAVFKIHGSVDAPNDIIITKADYELFKSKYELIRAQLITFFIRNPIVFIGYSFGDENVRNILETIFSYVDPKSELANKIRDNFLVVEYKKDSSNTDVENTSIYIGATSITIKKIETDNFTAVYNAIENLHIKVSAFQLRQVESIFKKITAGGSTPVSISNDLDDLDNEDIVLFIGDKSNIRKRYFNQDNIYRNYFEMFGETPETNHEGDFEVVSGLWFPAYALLKFNTNLRGSIKNGDTDLKVYQKDKLEKKYNSDQCIKTANNVASSIREVEENTSTSQLDLAIFRSVWERKIELDELKSYLLSYSKEKTTDYKMLLCLYDYMKYKD